MRKDVKLAFVVGGILISVLVVYVLVVPGGARKTASNQPVLFDTKSDKTDSAVAAKEEKRTTTDTPLPKEKSADQIAPAKPNETKGADTTVAGAGPATRPNDPFASKGTEEDKWYVALQTGTVPLMSSAPPSPQTNLVSGKGETSESAKSTELKTTDLTKPIDTSKPLDIAKPGEPKTSEAQDTTTVTTPTTPPVNSAPEQPPVVHADPPPAPSGTMRTHRVEKGETIAKIAEAAYGSQNYWPHIIRANPGIVAEKIRPGMVINLPPDAEVKGTGAKEGAKETPKDSNAKEAADTIHPDTTAGAKFDPTKEYEVQSGDSLAKIAIKLYGTEHKWQAIYDLNKEAIGTDPAKVKVKSVLKLPEAPTQKQ